MTEQPKAVSSPLLDKIRGLFAKKNELYAIRVRAGTQKFLVKNPKKMKYWMNMATNGASAIVGKEGR